MLRAGTGISVSHNPRTAAVEACAAAMTQAGLAQATGAIFFATTAHGGAFPLILRTIGEETKTREVVGCSAVGVIASRIGSRKRPRRCRCWCSVAMRSMRSGSSCPRCAIASREVALELAAAVKPALGRSNLLCILADTYNMNAGAVSCRARSRASRRRDRRRWSERGRFHRRDLPVLRRYGQLQFGFRDAAFPATSI